MLKRVSDTSVLQEECFIVQYQYVIHDKGAGSNRLGSETVYSGSSGAWPKLRDWASVAGRGRLLLSGSVAHASLNTAVLAIFVARC